MSDTVLVDIKNHIATITFNRPEKHNALNYEAYTAATDAFESASANADVRCIILTGAGKSFCSGDDVAEIMAAGGGLEEQFAKTNPAGDKVQSTMPPLSIAMRDSRVPIIAAVNGAALGVGIEFCLLCDIRIASTQARFSELFVKRGLVGTHVSYHLLPDIIGPAAAAELLLTGDIIDATMAQSMGLVSSVVQHDELLMRANVLAEKIAKNPPLAVAKAKQALRMKRDNQEDELDDFASSALGELVKTEDHKESVLAFIQKREAVFNGR